MVASILALMTSPLNHLGKKIFFYNKIFLLAAFFKIHLNFSSVNIFQTFYEKKSSFDKGIFWVIAFLKGHLNFKSVNISYEPFR